MAVDNIPTAASRSSSAPQPPWIELPLDVTVDILRRLLPIEILDNAQKVCTTWWRVCSEPSFWRVIDMKNPYQLYKFAKKEMVCRRAVDRSQGELIHISIDYFGSDKLLQYISHRSSHLKHLRLGLCFNLSAVGLTTALKNFPLLEELHLFFEPPIDKVDIETIGVSCPMLKAFTLNNNSFWLPQSEIDDSHALSISENMPNLLHLSLFGDKLSNKGLGAILDGCPNLESLDLRECFGVDLKCDMGRRCLEQIKELPCPFDSTADYEWKTNDYIDYYVDFYNVYGEGNSYCHDYYKLFE